MTSARVAPDLAQSIAHGDQPASAIPSMSSHELIAALPPDLARTTLDYIDWVLRSSPTMIGPAKLVDDICTGILNLGVPLDRYRTSTTVVTADADAIGRTWIRGQGITENVYVGTGSEDPNYLASPFYEAARTGTWVELWLPETSDERFGIVSELKADGYTHYLCIQFSTPPGIQGWITVATKSSVGFTREHKIVFALLVPVIGSQINMRIARLTLDRLLRTYVGDEPHRAILDGNVKRGQVSTIRSAILFADMRDSTGHTAEISAVEAVDLFNDFFDCLVPPIETRQGEVLKYIGDGLLAIFREGGDTENAATRALRAAKDGLARVAAYNQGRPEHRPIELGIALHYGEVAYGNVGSGLRLDFTVIGRDVGLASRIGGLNARLAEPLLMSSDFVTKLGQDAEPIGGFTVRGFGTPVTVFRPK